MKNLITLFLMMFTVSLVGCVTSPSELKESDFITRRIEVNNPVPNVAEDFNEAFRRCGYRSSGNLFAMWMGEPKCSPPKVNDGAIICDMYVSSPWHGPLGRLVGRVDIKPSQDGNTFVFLKKRPSQIHEDFVKIWEKAAKGQFKLSCPDLI